jgi:hypothetical protein
MPYIACTQDECPLENVNSTQKIRYIFKPIRDTQTIENPILQYEHNTRERTEFHSKRVSNIMLA